MASGAQRRIKSISYAKYGYLFILPFFLVYFFFQLWPLINTFILSFKDFTGENSVGLANYKALFKGVGTEPMNFSDGSTFKIADRTARVVHENFLNAFKNTIILWVGNFIPQIALSLSLAVWFTDAQLKIPGKGFFKIVMYLPNIITAASVAVLFLQLCGEAENVPGSLNLLLNKLGIVSQHAASSAVNMVQSQPLNFTLLSSAKHIPASVISQSLNSQFLNTALLNCIFLNDNLSKEQFSKTARSPHFSSSIHLLCMNSADSSSSCVTFLFSSIHTSCIPMLSSSVCPGS